MLETTFRAADDVWSWADALAYCRYMLVLARNNLLTGHNLGMLITDIVMLSFVPCCHQKRYAQKSVTALNSKQASFSGQHDTISNAIHTFSGWIMQKRYKQLAIMSSFIQSKWISFWTTVDALPISGRGVKKTILPLCPMGSKYKPDA
jgi:hypothetical protein